MSGLRCWFVVVVSVEWCCLCVLVACVDLRVLLVWAWLCDWLLLGADVIRLGVLMVCFLVLWLVLVVCIVKLVWLLYLLRLVCFGSVVLTWWWVCVNSVDFGFLLMLCIRVIVC